MHLNLFEVCFFKWPLALFVLANLIAVTLGEGSEKNILLIVTDDQSPNLGCYGDQVAQTPNLDALANEGVRFTQAFATTASCSASRSVMLTGLHNHKNGQYGHQHHFHKFTTYHDAISLSLPKVLADHGYRTARIGKFHVGPEKVYPFEFKLKANQRNPVQMANRCQDFIADDTDHRPFFLYFATSDPHRSGAVNRRSDLNYKPNLFGNLPNRKAHYDVEEVFYEANNVPVPDFLPDTQETREELAQYYQSCSRIDLGVGRLIEILKQTEQFEKTMIVFTSDHGMAFSGAKTTVYDPGLHVPLIVRHPNQSNRGMVCQQLVSHVDLTPAIVDFAGGLDLERNGPRNWQDPDGYWRKRGEDVDDNRAGGNQFRSYQGRSWLELLGDPGKSMRNEIFASHTFHEIQMYYPMRAIRDRKYKLIWNIAHKLDFPMASDLWIASSWQAQYAKGAQATYGQKTVEQYLRRPEFELYNIADDPNESTNLANEPGYLSILNELKKRLREKQIELNDPWRSKWEHE